MPNIEKIDLTVIIVNYNVKYYLEQCIHTIYKASENLEVEIIVVDNVSHDGSVEYISERFPDVLIIQNNENVGFGRANNQAVEIAKGEFVLFLNPDMVIAEDTLDKSISYLRSHTEYTALGPKLIDGTGAYLPESKRGFPSLSVAFYRLSGLHRIFKKSPKINGYYLGHLPNDQVHSVDVLVGCFILIRKKFLDDFGAFDPDYFMYGEDIDLSYRVVESGSQNVYFPDTTVIHYKGESTQKGSLNYVRMFYEAMLIFSSKHFTGSTSRFYNLFIKAAVIIRGLVSFVLGQLRKIQLYLFDFLIMMTSLTIVKFFWNRYVKVDINYVPSLTTWAFVIYSLIFILTLYLSGVYDRPYKKHRIWRGMMVGMIAVLVTYSLLPLEYRFSRGITLFGSMLGVFIMVGFRMLMTRLGVRGFDFREDGSRGVLIVGDMDDMHEIIQTFDETYLKLNIQGCVSTETESSSNEYLGTLSQLPSIAKNLNVNEIIFCQSSQLSYKSIIEWIEKLREQYEFKIFRKGFQTVIGSNSKNTAGDLYSLDPKYKITNASSKRNKRLFDILICVTGFMLAPVLLVFMKSPKYFYRHWWEVFISQKTWVGYYLTDIDEVNLPILKNSVYDIIEDDTLNLNTNFRIKLHYALNYHPTLDWDILRKNIF